MGHIGLLRAEASVLPTTAHGQALRVLRVAFASDQLSAAARVAASHQRMGADVDEKTVRPEDHRHRASRDISGRDVAFWIADRLTSLVEGMRK